MGWSQAHSLGRYLVPPVNTPAAVSQPGVGLVLQPSVAMQQGSTRRLGATSPSCTAHLPAPRLPRTCQPQSRPAAAAPAARRAGTGRAQRPCRRGAPRVGASTRQPWSSKPCGAGGCTCWSASNAEMCGPVGGELCRTPASGLAVGSPGCQATDLTSCTHA